MALWGRDDNIETHPLTQTVALDYSTGVVTGTGTTFGTFGKVGDIIRFGIRNNRGGGKTGVYFGDAVIKEVTSATSVTIASTDSLSGAAIAGTSFYLSELPIQTTEDHGWSNKHDTQASYQSYRHKAATDETAVGGNAIGIDYKSLRLGNLDSDHPDALVNDGNNIKISGLGTAVVAADNGPMPAGSSTLFVVAPPGIEVNKAHVLNQNVNHKNIKITSIGATTIGLAHTIASAVSSGDEITFASDTVISLASTISAGIATHDRLDFARYSGGYDRQVYGISTTTSGHYDGSGGKYRTEGGGWVGVTTYIDCHGKLRVKKEILVAMGGSAGITTGDYGIAYPTSVNG